MNEKNNGSRDDMYEVKLLCENCKELKTYSFKKGERVNENYTPCSNCGCKGVLG